MSFDMYEAIYAIIKGYERNSLLDDQITEIKIETSIKTANHPINSCSCCFLNKNDKLLMTITTEDKNGTEWKFKIKRQTFEKFKTADEIFKYLNKLKNQRLRRIARKTGAIIIKL